MKARALKDIPVVSMADGARVGNVQEVLFDTAALRIAALLLKTPNGQSILPFAAVGSIGGDAVMVASTAATEGAAGQTGREALRGLGDLVGLPVVTAEGTILGEVEDMELTPADGRLAALEVRSGGMLGIGVTRTTLDAAQIRMIGPKLITVDMAPQGDAGAGASC
jgi:uncharacterized protein YrrD